MLHLQHKKKASPYHTQRGDAFTAEIKLHFVVVIKKMLANFIDITCPDGQD